MRRRADGRGAAAAAALVLLLAAVAGARAAADEQGPAITSGAIEAQRRAIAAEMAELDEGEPRAEEQRRLLERLDRYLVQELDALDRSQELATDAHEAAATPGVADLQAPFDLEQYDQAADAADRAALLVRRLERASRDAADALTAARDALGEAEQQRRSAKDAVAAGKGDPIAAQAALHVRELESRVAQADVQLRTLELENATQALELNQAAEKRLRGVRDAMAGHLVLQPEDRQRRLDALESERADVRKRMREVRTEVEAATARLQAAEEAVSRDAEPAASLVERVAATRAERSALQREVSILAERLDRIDRLETWVKRRFAVLSGTASRGEMQTWYDAIREDLASLDREEGLKLAEVAEVAREREHLRNEEPASAAVRARHVKALERLTALYREDLEHLGASRDRGRRLLEALAARVNTWTLRDRAAQILRGARAVWTYEITSSEDRPITVGKVVLALFVFGLGYVVARLLAMGLGRRALPGLGFDPGAAQAFESLGFYAFLAVAFVVALRMVNIPLTAFAVVGGALAIGVGFGSQNVVSNFISGLILLAERPIKIGDLVELEGTYGNVERIGLRSTRVRTGENVHVIVPNAMFLENRVINWTHNDPQVRVKLAVGVTYGSPTREVERIVREVLDENPRVLKQPEPKILFTDFGDNALAFEAHFWLRMRVYMDRREVESQLRYRIDDRFREAGIVIAFPQRDVHVDTVAPLAVRLVREAGREEPSS